MQFAQLSQTHNKNKMQIREAGLIIIIIIIIGALGAIKKGLETYLGRIPGQLSISELQKITLLGTAHILRRVLSS